MTVKFCKSLMMCLLLATWTACNRDNVLDNNSETESDDDCARTTALHEEASDYTYDASTAIGIVFNGTSVTSASSGVTISGATATITAAGTYTVSGTTSGGQLMVNAPNSVVKIILNGVSITNASTAPVYIKKSLKTILITADGTTNTITDSRTTTATADPTSAIFSNTDISFYGNGTLTVSSSKNDGISTDDGVIIKSGTLNVTAYDDAIRGKDYLIVRDGIVKATATAGHALKSDNETDTSYGYVTIDNGTFTLTSGGKDGIHATHNVTVNGGTTTISATYGQGLKAVKSVTINDGSVSINKAKEGIESANINLKGGSLNVIATDDALNATLGTGGESSDGSLINISGGNIVLNSSGGDGLDSNGNVVMTGGTVIIHGPQSAPEVGLDVNGYCNINGGTFVASGPNAGNMIESASSTSTQCTVLIKFSSSKSAGSIIHIQNESGTDVATFAPTRAYNYIVLSSSLLTKGASYSAYTGGSYSTAANNGFYSGGTYTAGTLLKTFSTSASGSLTTITM